MEQIFLHIHLTFILQHSYFILLLRVLSVSVFFYEKSGVFRSSWRRSLRDIVFPGRAWEQVLLMGLRYACPTLLSTFSFHVAHAEAEVFDFFVGQKLGEGIQQVLFLEA
jgi:hypothetical protein